MTILGYDLYPCRALKIRSTPAAAKRSNFKATSGRVLLLVRKGQPGENLGLRQEVCMVCKHCQHNNPETNRFCGMCGQALPYPQVKSATTSIPSSSPNQAGTLGLRQSSASVGPIAPLAPKPQTAAPVSSEKKVQFPPVASPPQTSNPAASAQRTSAPATYAPVTSEKRVPPSVPPPTSVAPERRLGPRPPILEDTEKRAFVSPR